MNERRIIQVAVALSVNRAPAKVPGSAAITEQMQAHSFVACVADDGTAWELNAQKGCWVQLPTLPTKAD